MAVFEKIFFDMIISSQRKYNHVKNFFDLKERKSGSQRVKTRHDEMKFKIKFRQSF